MPEPKLSELKARAQQLKPSVRLGKAGLTPQLLAALEEALGRSQIVKLKFDDFKEERKRLAKEIAEKTESRLVQQVGHTAVFYRAAKPEMDAAPEV